MTTETRYRDERDFVVYDRKGRRLFWCSAACEGLLKERESAFAEAGWRYEREGEK